MESSSVPPVRRCFRNGKLTSEEKYLAVQRVQNGETKAAVARDINVPESTLRGWFKNAEKIRFLIKRDSITKMMLDHQQMESEPMLVRELTQQPKTLDEWSTVQRSKSGGSNDSLDGVDLTVSYARQDQSQYFGSDIHNQSIDVAPKKNVSSLGSSSMESFIGSQSNDRPTQFNNISLKENNLPNQSSIGTKSLFHSMSNNPSNLPVPSSPPIPSTTPNDTQQFMSLWHSHDFNQSVIERIVNCSPTISGATNFRLPEGLNISPNPAVVQPTIENRNHSVKVPIPVASPKTETIVTDFDKNNNNNNCVPANNKENCTEIVDASEAMKCAEKFSKWFQTYSDPTLTHQDVLRFEQLLGKVRKIVERRSNGNVRNLKIRRRK